MSILKIKDKDGNWVGITSIKGDKGEAGEKAYDSAKKGGYTGTEEEFNADIAKVNLIDALEAKQSEHSGHIGNLASDVTKLMRQMLVGEVMLDSATANSVFGESCNINRAFELIDERIKELEGQ